MVVEVWPVASHPVTVFVFVMQLDAVAPLETALQETTLFVTADLVQLGVVDVLLSDFVALLVVLEEVVLSVSVD